MNFEQAKALRLKHWRDTLDDHDFRMQSPERHRSTLHEISARLTEEGLINPLDQFDMDEMANAAYWLAVEELQACPILYRPSYGYDVVPKGGGPRFGKIFHSILMLDNNLGNKLQPYDGKVCRDGTGLMLKFSYANTTGRIDGLTLTLDGGRQFDLVATERMVEGVVYPVTEDPDVYRWMLDVVQVATENKHFSIMEKVRPFFEMAKFLPCSACQDHFGKRDDCAACGGLGFAPKPEPPSYTLKPEE
ncbi:hypothetical protein MKS85_00330 [Pseudomonas sp. JL2]|uniref:hypothetical protein n=1 Tax=Pseudomonas sp. JL2 TaxID=2919942 RepID=UPI002854795C|nr:hypothetical protein [Pseudomonas sp. JL2]MDR8383967.1 hypothetical protein [Pseudomonas sp. JL2]